MVTNRSRFRETRVWSAMGMRDAMGDVGTTIEYLIEEGDDGEIEENGRRDLNDKSST